jgi:hypothetical protein
MKYRSIAGLIFLFCFYSAGALAEKPETLAEMKTRAEGARPADCVRLCADTARRAFDEAKNAFAKGEPETGRLALADVATFAEKATDASILTRKREKQLEIELRAISHRLADLKRSVAFEDQPALETTMEQLEKLRTQLLESMFGKAKK